MIRFEHVGMSYDCRKKLAENPVLVDVHLHIPPGELVCLLGVSGCGKTTLLNLAAGFLRPTTGQVLFAGKPVQGPGPERGMVFQDATLFPWLTVSGNIGFALKRQGIRGKELEQRLSQYLAMMDLVDHAGSFPCGLSGGMRQRVGIARVLAMESPLLLMDEPFSALDALTRERLQEELLQIHKNTEKTILYVTHSVAEAAYLADRIIILRDGGVVFDSPVVAPKPRQRTASSTLALEEQLREILCSKNNNAGKKQREKQ